MNKPGVSKWIVVTGAASGIGLATARTLLEAGMNVIALDRDAEKLDTAFEHQKASVITRQVDVTDAEHSRHVMNAVRSETGPLWGLVNAAGIFPVTPFISLELDEWDQVLNTNLRGAFIIAQWVAQAMIEDQITGAIINVTSTSATFCRPGVTHYGASKAGLTQLTRDMALELAEYGIRVNAVAPGLVATDWVLDYAKNGDADEHTAKLAAIPLGRMGDVEEIANLICFLLSDQCSYSTGSTFLADGGLTLGIPRY
tara:strand:+ start:574 stop:1341 length:768 start_codon:yes stop_codon:yes gene_type:complete